MRRTFKRRKSRNQSHSWTGKIIGLVKNFGQSDRSEFSRIEKSLKQRISKNKRERSAGVDNRKYAQMEVAEPLNFRPINSGLKKNNFKYNRRNYYQIAFYLCGALFLLGFIWSVYNQA